MKNAEREGETRLKSLLRKLPWKNDPERIREMRSN